MEAYLVVQFLIDLKSKKESTYGTKSAKESKRVTLQSKESLCVETEAKRSAQEMQTCIFDSQFKEHASKSVYVLLDKTQFGFWWLVVWGLFWFGFD